MPDGRKKELQGKKRVTPATESLQKHHQRKVVTSHFIKKIEKLISFIILVKQPCKTDRPQMQPTSLRTYYYS